MNTCKFTETLIICHSISKFIFDVSKNNVSQTPLDSPFILIAISKHKFELYQLIIFFIQHVLQVLGHFLSMFALLHRFFNLLHNATESSHAKMDHEETKELHEEEAHDGTTI